MISFFPDLNVWLALSYAKHSHRSEAWRWLDGLPLDCALLLCRYTQLGLLRLLTNGAVMGVDALTLDEAWTAYDHWIEDPRVEFHPDPRQLGATFRQATQPFAAQRASKLISDCYLLAFAKESGATLVTFDRALLGLARKQDCAAILPG
jgi:toxin-antitoxin system PIN domain toxin